MLKSLVTVILLTGIAFAQKSNLDKDLAALVQTEHDFSALSAKDGIRSSFLSYLADDAILFKPLPVPGKKFMSERPAAAGVLTWEPTMAEVSLSRELGFTTGPWEYRKTASDTAIGYGTFVTVWKKVDKVGWRVAADIGITHPALASKETFQTTPPITASSYKRGSVEKERAGLLETERAFSNQAQSKGIVDAYTAFAANNIRVLRDEKLPVIGKEAAISFFTNTMRVAQWKAERVEVSKQADIGYTYGMVEEKKGDAAGGTLEYSSYLHIWQRQSDGSWKVVIDIENPTPKPKDTPKE